MKIPEHMMGAIERYITHGIPPGSFLLAVIDNNLQEAIARADDENLRNLPAFVAFFYKETPLSCWGSPDIRRAWMAKKQQEMHVAPKEED